MYLNFVVGVLFRLPFTSIYATLYPIKFLRADHLFPYVSVILITFLNDDLLFALSSKPNSRDLQGLHLENEIFWNCQGLTLLVQDGNFFVNSPDWQRSLSETTVLFFNYSNSCPSSILIYQSILHKVVVEKNGPARAENKLLVLMNAGSFRYPLVGQLVQQLTVKQFQYSNTIILPEYRGGNQYAYFVTLKTKKTT